ncbi:uncharacterized protein [Nicotiana sylvestris]|uniref:uncharacterized protein n=1 Tax=Nicotiana sylvestris TaxID=4096 RepID=UPI00388CBD31
MDGASNAKGSGLSIVLKPPMGNVVRQSIRTMKLNNNEAEYEGVIARLKLAKALEPRWSKNHVPRDQNSEADALANLGLSVDDDEFSSRTVVQLMKSVIEEGHAEVNSMSLTWDWRNKYIDYLKTGKLPSDPKESRATKATRFSLVEGTLFRRAFNGPLARCLELGDTEYAVREVYEGTCENHLRVESLVRKLIKVGYYWTQMEKDAKDFVQKCDSCQRHPPMIYQPGELLHTVMSPWPFMKWGTDIAGPLPWAPGKA